MAGGSRHSARRTAVQALYQWDLTEQSPDQIENHFINEYDLSGTDLEYFHKLVRQVPLYRQELDENLRPFLDRDLDAVDPVEKAILRLGAYELEYEPTIPHKAILNEAVELAKTFGAEHGYKFVNGVLDKLALKLRPHSD
ncbi:MAG: transcription antitermination factor NusB [Gammaproteobacteria bacterium]|nr:transcription antitermination factor NusB [Gammaproteobacteria bacterium]